jgi:hypothetical protein
MMRGGFSSYASAVIGSARLLSIPIIVPLVSACVVETVTKTAVDVVTLPIKAVSAGVDAVTTSQSEADEKRGREIRKQEEERGKRLRLAEERCRKGKPLPTDNCAPAPR